MHPVFKKLNFKDHPAIYVIDAPASFEAALEAMRAITKVFDSFARAKAVTFAIAFATTKEAVDRFAAGIAKSGGADAVVWVAYPKGTSKKYRCEFNRDTGWDRFAEQGFEPVRMVAIDEDWSALRFRRVEHIKTMTRRSAISKAGQAKIGQSAATRRA